MNGSKPETVLVVCEDEGRAHEILSQLFAEGVSAVGPASTAGMALAMAAQTSPSLALVAQSPTGRRDAHQLARNLFDTWGVKSLVLPDAIGVQAQPEDAARWAPPAELADRLRALLKMDETAG